MSKLWVNQDFEVDASPFTLTDKMVRSATNAITTTSLRGGDGAAGAGRASYSLANPLPSTGSRRALRIQARFAFREVTRASGGTPSVLALTGSTSLTFVLTSGRPRITIGSAGATATAALTTGNVYTFDLDYREERAASSRTRLYQDGALVIDLTGGVTDALQTLSAIQLGTASAKTTWEYIWDDMKLWTASDPQ